MATATRAKATAATGAKARTPETAVRRTSAKGRAASPDTTKVTRRGKGKATTATATAPARAEIITTSGPLYEVAPESPAVGTGTGATYFGQSRKPLAERSARRIADALRMAGDATRTRIVWHLRAIGPTNVTGLCVAFGTSQPALSHHLSLMRHGGIVEPRRDGKHNVYELTPKGQLLADAMASIDAASAE